MKIKTLLIMIMVLTSLINAAGTTIDITSETLGSSSGGFKQIGTTNYLISDTGSNTYGGGSAYYRDSLAAGSFTYSIKTTGDPFALKNFTIRLYQSKEKTYGPISLTLKDQSGNTLMTKSASVNLIENTPVDILEDGYGNLSDLKSQVGVYEIEVFINDTKSVQVGLNSFVVTEGAAAKAEPTNYPTNFTATTNSANQITTSWTDATGAVTPDSYLVMCSTSNSFTDPSDGTAQTDDTDCSDGSGVQNIT